MATTIKLKNGSGAPLAGDLVQGEPALDLTNKRLYTEDSGGTVIEVGTNPSTLTVDTTTLVVDATNNRVGVGTGSPSYALDVVGNIKATNSSGSTIIVNRTSNPGSVELQYNGTQTAQFSALSGGGIATYVGSSPSEAMRIDSSGRVGIGTTSPEVLTHLKSSDNTIFEIESTTATAYMKMVDSNTTGAGYIGYVTNDMTFWANNAERMRIDSSGSLGLGTNDPSSFSFSNGPDIIIGDGTDDPHLSIVSPTTGTGYVAFADGTVGDARYRGLIEYAHTTDYMGFRTGALERMRIDSSGNLLVNSTSAGALVSSGRGLIDVDGTSDSGIELKAAGSTYGYLYTSSSEFRVANLTANPVTFFTNNTERMRIDSSGNLLVGRTTSGSLTVAGSEFQAGGASFHVRDGGTALYVGRKTSDGALVEFSKDGTTVGSIASVGGTGLRVNSQGSTGYLQNGGSDKYTWSDSAFAPANDNLRDLGSASYRFDDVYATNGTIQTSDVNEKQDIEALSDAETRVAVAAKGLLRKFRWKSAVEEKDDAARIHFGIIAQDLQAAFEAEGLDAGRYAMFIHSTWTDEETGEERSRMGVRYSELLAFIIAAI
jgi:hypothetical protein